MQILSIFSVGTKLSVRMLAFFSLCVLGACGGSTDLAANLSTAPSTLSGPPYSIGGTVSGLAASGVVLANGPDTLALGATDTSFTMPTRQAPGTTYSIEVQRELPGTTCSVASGGGTVGSSNVSNVAVSCASGWAWLGGSNTVAAHGVYGTQGVPAASNIPGARESAATWTDSNGDLWLFGGFGYVAAGAPNNLNDLWKYSWATGQWTWMAGGTALNASGVYGTQGVAAVGNTPGGRDGAVAWTDPTGNLWLMGGEGYDSAGAYGYMNDLWTYSPATGLWAWVGGANTVSPAGTYGTQGTPNPSNVPGGRFAAVALKDSNGDIWMFGGYGYDSTGTLDDLNDLWKYSRATGQWTWVSGPNIAGQTGSYGTQGVAAPSNAPGAREAAMVWLDASDNLWIFGGVGYDAASNYGQLNDLWKFSSATGQWTWVKGSNLQTQAGTYGTIGVAAPGNQPGTRNGGAAWKDAAGDMWLMGGMGQANTVAQGELNDLWKYSPSTNMWTWVRGSNVRNVAGTYGTLATPSAANDPGGRNGAAAWLDKKGNLILMGGTAYDSAGSVGRMNDLWRY